MELNLDNKAHKEFKESVLNELDKEKSIATPDLADQVKNTGDWSGIYIRNLLLPQTLDYLREKGKAEVVRENPEGGLPTQYWVKTEGE